METGKDPIVATFGAVLSMLLLASMSGLVALASVGLRRLYHRVMWGPRKHRRPVPAAESRRESESVGVDAGDVARSTNPGRVVAAATTRDAQLAHAIAGLVYAAIVAGILIAHARLGLLENSVVTAYASLAPSLLIVLWSMRVALRRRFWVFLIYAALGALIIGAVVMRSPLHSLFGAMGFALLPICLLVPLFRRSINPFVFLLLPLVILLFAIGILIDQLQPEVTREALKTAAANPWVIPIGLANVVVGFYLARKLLRKRWPVPAAAFAIALLAIVIIELTTDEHVPNAVALAGGIASMVLQMLMLGAFVGSFGWLQKRRVLTSGLLHIHFAWTVLTVYFEVWARLQPMFVGTRWGFVLALLFSTVTLHGLLFLLRRRRDVLAEKRLLLLRVFGGPDERQDLLDDLRDTWRRIGAIDLLAGRDLAVVTLQPTMLQAFLLRMTDQQFVRKEGDIEGRLGQRHFAIEADARYPVNPIYCSGDNEIWKSVFVSLEKGVDAVLMDVRGFTSANEGIKWELGTLLQHTELHRIVLLSDESTRSEELKEVLAGREVTTLKFERRSDRERWALFDLLLNATYASSGAKAGIS